MMIMLIMNDDHHVDNDYNDDGMSYLCSNSNLCPVYNASIK